MSLTENETKKLLIKFLTSAKKNFEEPSYKELFRFAKTFSTIESVQCKPCETTNIKTSRKNTTEPGGEFDASLCYCRVWNKGVAKQCSSKPKENDMCGTHLRAYNTYGGWSLGLYCDPKPDNHLFSCGGGKVKGDPINWKSEKYNKTSKKDNIVDPLVMKLKDRYEKEFGKRPRGPKASDITWLKFKLNITESDSDLDSSESESDDDMNDWESFKKEEKEEDENEEEEDENEEKEDEEEENEEDEEEDEEEEEKDENEEKEDEEEEKDENEEDDDKIAFKYDGITYFKVKGVYDDEKRQEVVNEDDDTIGWLHGRRIDFEDGYDEIHKDMVNDN